MKRKISKIKKTSKKKITKRSGVQKRKRKNTKTKIGIRKSHKNPDEKSKRQSLNLPSTKEDIFKLGFIIGFQDGYNLLKNESKTTIRNYIEIANNILSRNDIDMERSNIELIYNSINYMNVIDLYEFSRFYGIKKSVEKASFSDTPLDIDAQLIIIERLINSYEMTGRLPEFKSLEML